MKQILILLALVFALQADAQMIHREPAGGTPAQFTVTEYKTPGAYTWTKPDGCIAARVICIGGGGGGGSGGLFGAGTNRSGGSGGWSGSVVDATFLAFELDSASYTVKVGAGGAGGAAQTTNTTAGNNGETGGTSKFSNLAQAPGGLFGTAGSNFTSANPSSMSLAATLGGDDGILNLAGFSMNNAPGFGRASSSTNIAGAPSSAVTSVFTSTNYNLNAPGSGAGGSGVTSANVELDLSANFGGGVHADTTDTPLLTSQNFSTLIVKGGAVGVARTAGANGTDHVARYYKYTTTAGFGTGGGGGGGSNTDLVTAGAGGRGGHGGGGGGGGGGGTNGGGSGAGGDGGDGVVIIIAFY